MGTARKVRSAVAIALVSTVVVLVAQAPPASAASITVNTALDIAPNAQGQFPTDGKCSLRAAIQSAQNNSNAHDVDCSTGAPVANVLDTVQIDPSLAGQTMTLTYSIAGAVQPFPTISGPTNPMKIIGPNTNAAAFKISGGGAVRPFIVGFLTAEAGNLTLANLTVQGGNGANGAAGAFAVNGQGGALYASDNSKLTFDNAVFTGNSAVKGGAIYAEWPTITNNGGAYTSNSASDEGGAIFLNQGPSTLNGYAMLLASNTAGDKGGAIAVNPGSSNPFIHLERSLIRNNSTSIAGNGGVVYIQPSGAPTGTTFELTDSTVFANSSVFLSTATTQKYNFERSTFKDTGNLINGTGGGTVWNSIITGTSCQTQVAIGNFVGAGNLISPGSCDLMGMGSMGSVTGMSATLAQNGGPEVQQTFALSAGSNAIDNGGNAHCGTVDARSVTRGLDGNGILNNPQVGDCDIGAYEYAKYVVNFVTGTSTAKEDAGTKNVQVKLRILDPGISSTPSAVFVPITNQATSTATISNDFTLGGGGVTFPAGSVDGAVANLQVNLIQDDVAELFGEEAHLDLATNVVGVAIAEPNSHTLSIQDDDQAGVIVDDGGNGTNVAEATPLVGEDITVRLQSQPDRQLLDPTKPGLPASYGPPANVTMSVNVDRDCIVLWNGEVASIGDPFQITIPNADWKTGRTMTVRSKDDLYDEDLRVETVKHTCEIRFTFESLDPIYDATQDAYEANIADNDVAGVNLDRKSGPAVLRENTVDAATYELMLDTPPDPGKPLPPSPRPPTVITLSVGTGCDIGAGDGKPMTYAFTEANWSTARTVSVTSTNNLVVELLHPCTITSSVSGGDPIYNDLSQPPTFSGTPPTATEQVQDYDPPGVTDDPPFAVVTTNGADGADVDEGAPATPDTVSVVLLRAPKGNDVTFTMATSTDPVIAGPQVAVTKPGGVAGPTASLTFTPANWNVAQTLHVFPVDDDYDEADTHPWTLQATMTSSAPGFNSATLRRFVIDQAELEGPATVDATITDDDTSAFDVRNTGADTTVLENVSGDKVDVRLATHPYATVDVTVTASSRCTVNGGASTTVTVLAGDWNVAHLVDVAAVDNNALEGPKQCQLTFDATSTDALYDDLDPITKDVDIVDDEVPGVDVKTDDGVAVSETGTTDTFQVVLRAQPTADVTVDLFDDQTLTVSGVTFTPANWNTPKIVTVAADDDDIDEDDPHPGEVVMGVTSTAYGFSTAPVYDVDSVETKTIPVSVGDDDEAGFTLSTTSLTLAEAGSADTFTLQLMSEPIADVTVTPTATGLCTSSPTTLTFTAADWDTPQTVTVTPGSDDIDHAQSCKVSSAVTSTDPKYASKGITDVTGAVTDDDTAGVTPSKTSLTLAEGGVADSYTLVLDSEPTADVKITPAATGLCTVGGFLTFTAANWDAPQTVTVTPGTDAVDQDATCTIGHTAASTDATYAGFAVADVSGAVTDDDTAAVTLSKTALTLAEGGAADTYTIVLATQPTADVVVTPTATGLCTVSGPLTFTAADWSTAQTVTVTPGNDSLYKPQSCTITHATTTTDAAYDAVVVADASGALEEDETSVVTLSKVALTLTEAGPADTYTIELVLPPTADVVVDLAATGLCSVGPGQVTFTTANWNVARTITVTPGSDDVVHAQECTVSHTTASDDATYDAIVVEDAKGAVVDDDVASVETSQDALTLTESGADDTYTVVLTSKPSGDVTVAFAATGLCSVSPSSRTFTSANWDEPQPVAVTPGDDDIVHVQSCSIGHTVTSTDTNYDGVNPAALSGAVAEDDTAGVTVSDTSLTLVEGGADDTYSVELTSEPLSSVTVTVAASGLCSALPATLTFTAADWDQAQTVTVTPGDDDIVHAQSCTVTQTAASGDGSYDGTAVADPTGPVVEDDTASVDLTGAALTLTESGAADTYTIVLGSEPTADVVVTPTAAGLCSATGALTFTPADWDTAQTVTVTPGDDDIVHAQSCTVSHAVASADATYAAITPADASGAVADDDTAGVVLSKTALTLAEAGAADTYTVRLTSEPVSDVVIGVADTGLCAATPATLTFTDADWDTAQTVTVTPGSDDIVHAQPCTVAHDATSSDPAYDGIAVEDASGGVSDDDTAGATASKTTLALAEAGAADTYTLVLASEPTDDVEITLTATGLCSVAPGSITFTSHTWDTAQTVTVTPGEDDIVHAQSCSIGHAVASDDPAYDGLVPATVAGAVTDDDTAGVALSGTALELDESGDDDTYTAALTSQPASDVTVAVAAGGLCASSPASLTFTAADWDVPQTITVTPGDDDIVHAQSCTVSHTVTSADADYDGATVTDATGPVVDDDTAGVDASKDGLTLTESGPADTYSVVLTSEPTADVVVTPTASGLCSVSGSLTFTAADWDVPQTITVTPGDDDVVHAQSCSIGHASASADPAYTGLQIGAVGGAVVDDDTAGVEVVAGPVVLHEATPATTDTYTVALASEPLADVTVAITTADGQTSADRADLTFTAADWDVPQAVTLTVVDDATLEASPHDGVVAHATSSTDPAYGPTVAITVDGAAGDEMTASIGDDETATDLALSAPADDETSVTATATVTGGDDPRTGTVQFALDGTEVGLPVALTGDTAELDLGILAVGPHEVSATYGGDSLHDGSADTATTEVGIVARAAGDAVELAEDGDALVDVLANDKGVDDVEGWTQGAHGAVDCTAAGCTYTPDADFNGTDAFTYQATDGSDVTDPATVEVTVTAVNDAPEPGVVSVSVVSGESVTFDVLDGATDVDGDPITVSAHGQPAHGTVACTPAGSCTYTPEPGYTGTDSFTYTLSDGTGEVAAQAVRAVRAGSTSTGTATITVEAAPTPPTTPDPGSPGPGTDPNGPGGTGGVGGTGGTGTGTGGPLPRTGTDPRSLVALGAVLLAVGALVLRVRRRPTPTSTP